jgi:major membrane immunogen (membrane-anchored lipoprotein)
MIASKMMKKIGLFVLALILSLTLVACGDTDTKEKVTSLTILDWFHLDGHGAESTFEAPILFEYEARDFVKYQVAYLSCTCRAPRENYWSVVYYEIDKNTGEVLMMSYDYESTDHYITAFWGDSSPIPDTGVTYEDFKSDFIPWLEGKTLDDLEGINIFYDNAPSVYSAFANTKTIGEPEMIDAYSGSSVSTNNMIRITKALLAHHKATYMAGE